MGDRHGGRFARRGRALSPPRRDFPTARGGFPMAQGGGQDLPARERSPRRKPPDTAHERKDLPRARTLPTAKASRHGAQAKGFARAGTLPSAKASHTAHGRRDLPHAGTLSSAKASRHSARAKGFAPRENAPHGEGLPTRRTSERICPAGFAFAPRADERRDTLGRRTAEKHPFGGVAPTACGRCRVHSPKKIRLLHEIQLFYGESHVGSRPIFPSFPSVGRCVARERNPVPPFAPHRGRGHRSLRRDGEVCHGFGEMVRRFGECPRGGKSLPRGGNAWPLGGGRRGPGLRCFGERFHRRRCANPEACRGQRCSRG